MHLFFYLGPECSRYSGKTQCLASPLGDSKGLEPFQSPSIGEDGPILFWPLLLWQLSCQPTALAVGWQLKLLATANFLIIIDGRPRPGNSRSRSPLVVTILQSSNCAKTQTLKLLQNSKNQIVTKLKTLNCDKSPKLKLWQNSNTQILTKLKNSNWYKTQNSNCDQNQKVSMWQNSMGDKTQKLKLWKTF